MKKKVCIILAMLLLVGCGRDEDSLVESSLDANTLLEELATQETESQSSEVIYPEHVGSGGSIGAHITGEARHLLNIGTYAEDDVTYIIGQTLQYQGERIPLNLYVSAEQNDKRIETMTTTVFLLCNGVPQPFYWGDEAKEVMHATFTATTEEMYEGKNLELSFIPADAPYGSKSAMALFFITQDNYHFTTSNIMMSSGGGGLVFYVAAASEEYEVNSDAQLPVAGELGTYQFDPNKDSHFGAIAITNKVTSGEQLDMNTALIADEQLYATFVVPWDSEENTAFDVFAFMDGEPLYAINGS